MTVRHLPVLLPLTLATLGVVHGPAAAADRPDPFAVLTVRVTIAADEYAAMQPRSRGGFFGMGATPKPADPNPDRELHRNQFNTDLPWATGDVTLGDQAFKGVGVRYKGNGTILDTARTVKKSFRFDLDRTGGTGRFRGSKTVNLHCGVADPSKYREAFGYAVYRAAGVPAPITSFAEVRLTVPGKFDDQLLGLYTLTEEVDKAFLKAHFGADGGLLMKPEGVRDFEDKGDDWGRYKTQYRPKREATADEAKRVIAFAKLVHKADDAAFRKEIAGYLDADAYLRFLAVTSFIANIDCFFALGHNYYLYLHPTTGRFHLVPWDLDRAFANLPFLGSSAQQMDMSLTRPYHGSHRLTERILAMPGMGDKYRALCRELADTVFAKERLLKEVAAAEAGLKGPLERDAAAAKGRKEPTGPQSTPFGRPPALRTFVERRTASVAAQLAGTSKGFVPTAAFGPPKMGDILAGPFLENLDADADGSLSRAEWLAAAKRVHAAGEADAGGRLTQKAIATGLNGMFPPPPEGSPPPAPGFTLGEIMAGPIVTRADADKDGKVTADELAAAAGAAFDQFDKAKAGKLDYAAFADMLTAVFPTPNFGPPPAPPKKKD